ncbi:hypothetical protein [Actinomadura chokoriensis]|uniref:Mce-associated membrane protein n=1 Tax=Actinomadura chokoriensis TaxID=454156 RepID=A0ABV4R9R1_9ACTN
MTAKTGKDEVDEVEAVPTEERAETEEVEQTEEAAARPARPAAKRKRRVRVIEVIDDEDLDDVLEALDAEDEDAEDAEEPARPAKPTAKAAAKPAAKATAKPASEPAAKPAPKAVKPRPTRLEPPEEEAGEAAPDAAPARPGLFRLPLVPTVVFVVLVALLASLAIWKWTSASSMSSDQDAREEVGKVASAYGDIALNYNAQNYQSQMDKAQKLMGGDLLETFKTNTLPNLGETFKSNPELVLTSKTNQVFVGSVDDRFATAVIMVDISVKTKEGATDAPATLLRLALAKIDGKWKITKHYPSGTNDQNQQQQTQLPGTVPSSSASASPKAGKTEKPKN